MKIIDAIPNTTVPGFYWDGCVMYFVDANHCQWCLGGNRAQYAFVESDSGGISADGVVQIIDAVERVYRTAKDE